MLFRSIIEVAAIIPAAGLGNRMCTNIPKQYLVIDNKTLLEHAVYALMHQKCIREIIIAINPKDQWYHNLSIADNPRVRTVTGGETRADSVLAALQRISNVSWVLVHDAVRPCVYQSDLHRLLSITSYTKIGGLLAMPVRDTLKRSYAGTKIISNTIERKYLWHALTPQLFTIDLLKKCLKNALAAGVSITDESSALEYYGYEPLLVPGRTDNIKVTCQEDLSIVRFFLSQLTNAEKL